MNICFPIVADNGLESEVYNHFGSAPSFVVVDSETGDFSRVINSDAHHAHGSCSPMKALNGHSVDAVVVGGIGGGALNKLKQAGIRVYKTQGVTVSQNVELFSAGSLREFSLLQTCGGHGGECSH
ncbi:MAG: diguanylate cyclase [Nitrospirales bacterium]|nr:diguanylate cyclase [Nitrospirales bacterium]